MEVREIRGQIQRRGKRPVSLRVDELGNADDPGAATQGDGVCDATDDDGRDTKTAGTFVSPGAETAREFLAANPTPHGMEGRGFGPGHFVFRIS